MADTMQFDLVAPERLLASLEATAVQIPGAEGDMTAMPDHAPTITTLRPGILTVESAAGEARYMVTGGFAEISAQGTSVLAEEAVPAEEVTEELLNGLIATAKETQGEDADATAKRAADIAAIGAALGIATQG